jgi:hypothetical protein
MKRITEKIRQQMKIDKDDLGKYGNACIYGIEFFINSFFTEFLLSLFLEYFD